jgi:ABC-type phosphate transport system auxiliary subunit
MVNPRIMCRQHLLGEHAEIHMFIGAINRGKSVKEYLQKRLLEVHNLYNRHEELVEEMKRRGYMHCSDLDEKWRFAEKRGFIDRKKSFNELVKRCSRCNYRYSGEITNF